MVDIWLPYGNTEVCVRVPTENLLDVIVPTEMAAMKDPQAEVENALRNPFSAEPLDEVAKSGDKVAIVLKDSGASVNQLIVSAILKVLNSAGVNDQDVGVTVAYDPFSEIAAETIGKPTLSEELTSRISVMRHNCEMGEYVYLGETSRGTKVHLNKTFTESKVKILAGVIEPHIYAGYSGGRDGVLPGVSKIETVRHNLLLSLKQGATRGSLEGNPVHEDMVEAAHMAGVSFILNVVRNSKLEVVKAFAGDADRAFGEGAKLVEEMYRVSTERRADLAVVSPGGSPFDIDLFETCRGIDGALEVTRREGAVVIVAECINGYGNSEFYKFMTKFNDPEALEKALKKKFSASGFVAYYLMKARQRFKIYLVSAMPDYNVSEAFRIETARTANEGLRYAFDAIGKKGKVSIIPCGRFTMPQIKSSEER